MSPPPESLPPTSTTGRGASSGRGLEDLRFDPRFMRELPADPSEAPGQRQVHGAAYSKVRPTPTAAPELLIHSEEVARMLELDPPCIGSQAFAEVFSGNRVLPGTEPYATAYGGHQFGHWARQLGDGRAISLGEVLVSNGDRYELQLKGAGPTPYSRGADGRAVLRSSIREFLCSEAMAHLGVPTTRALSLVSTGDQVLRDMLYDGNVAPEPGAVVCRVAPTFIRFGHFELPASRGDVELLRAWVRHTIGGHFAELPEIAALGPDADLCAPEAVLAWFGEVARRTAEMIVHWMRVGFVHGVMNTDNMSVLGLTIDYGPYGWVDDFDPGWTPNTTDAQGRRYRFGAQPRIALWNLARLAEALIPLVEKVEPLEAKLEVYADTFDAQMRATWARKLGFEAPDEEIDGLVERWQRLLGAYETDMTIAFVELEALPGLADPGRRLEALGAAWYGSPPASHREATAAWVADYLALTRRRGGAEADRRARMEATNPRYVLRNYMAQQAIEAAEAGELDLLHELLEVVRAPYGRKESSERWYARRPDWARHKVGCSMLSCSS